MKLVNFSVNDEVQIGALTPEGLVSLCEIDKSIPPTMEAFIAAGEEAMERAQAAVKLALSSGRGLQKETPMLLSPVASSGRNIFCVGRNYREHVRETARSRGVEPVFPLVPEFFTKPRKTVIGPLQEVASHPNLTRKLDYEVELGVVLGKSICDADPEQALAAVFGYTIVNDISARDLQVSHGQWFKGKSLDTFCPIGPCIVTRDEFDAVPDLRLLLRVNGETRQGSRTSDMIFSIGDIIVSLSAGMSLESGDVISTGTPQGVGFGLSPQIWLQAGDVMEAEIEGIGILRNTVSA